MTQNEIYDNAMLILSQRDHSIKEIKEKLAKKEADSELIDAVIALLLEYNYLNDRRFAQIYIRSKASRLYGQFRIRQELKQKGVTQEDIAIAFDEEPVDWYENAKSLRHRKFGTLVPSDFKAKSKQMRYLQSHGFSFDEINYSFEPEEH
ncbi:regulatory protein RecX [Marinomonas balearica]|uniref:Regulatory protein RecX n=1 Tax=Marinomonas balearica TaxID=491947 RepID=A0A4R6MHM3_9GAMM|nr:regulatory protein RecX [Marinomonas balearica]TDP01057.1 regulatory protein [Marinomonas balearica]